MVLRGQENFGILPLFEMPYISQGRPTATKPRISDLTQWNSISHLYHSLTQVIPRVADEGGPVPHCHSETPGNMN